MSLQKCVAKTPNNQWCSQSHISTENRLSKCEVSILRCDGQTGAVEKMDSKIDIAPVINKETKKMCKSDEKWKSWRCSELEGWAWSIERSVSRGSSWRNVPDLRAESALTRYRHNFTESGLKTQTFGASWKETSSGKGHFYQLFLEH